MDGSLKRQISQDTLSRFGSTVAPEELKREMEAVGSLLSKPGQLLPADTGETREAGVGEEEGQKRLGVRPFPQGVPLRNVGWVLVFLSIWLLMPSGPQMA